MSPSRTTIRNLIRWIPLVIIGLSGSVFGQSEMSVKASVNKNELGSQETLIYTVEIQSDGAISNLYAPQAPEANNLTLVQSAPSTAQSQYFSNATGTMQQSISFTWYFRPVQTGSGSVGRTTVVIGENTYATQPINVKVLDAPQSSNTPRGTTPSIRPRSRSMFDNPFTDPDNAEERDGFDNSDFFIRAYPNARKVYQNQQMAVDYFLFVRRGIEIRNSRLADSWDAEGFWREEMEVDHDTQMEIMNDISYRKILLKRIVIFPTRAGALRIDPLEIQGDASRTRTGSPFGMYLRRPNLNTESITIRSPAVNIEALPTPSNAPPSFSGAVGDLEMDVEVDRERLEVGETVTLTVKISGTGNIATLSAPIIELPTMLERYDPTVVDRIYRNGRVVSGYKTFSYVIVPRSNGTYEIPAISYAFFDANGDTFKTLRSSSFSLSVTGNAEPALTTLSSEFPSNDIAALISSNGRWTPLSEQRLHERLWPVLLLILPLVMLGLLFGFRKHSERLTHDVEFARGRKASALARRHLKTANSLMKDDLVVAFYEEIARALLSFVGNRLNVAEKGLTYEQLLQRLSERSVSDKLLVQFQNILSECDLVRYAPVSQSAARMEEVWSEAGEFLTDLDAQLPQARARSIR